ncbi:ABC transporter substrate-binding protein [Natronomonas salina]|uniref:ABC transporter substrate-binding protein n=1 Tax=Natronomonas salina TaxID=1710540 RepID=UPI0015B66B3F|nr:ABC transporter substrate-binding protein [Natronomonas salina]QLD88337.1 ABC transporter substrate-binding protein [Natronomonas salina]
MSPGPSLRRRALLAGAAGTLTATSGCVGELRNLLGRESTSQLELSIATTPASYDPYAVRVANRLSDHLEQAGIATFVDLLSPDVLLRNVLINQDFDIYISRYPSEGSPDELRTLLHSSYGEESGWQNPFGYSNLRVDELLAEQRSQAGETRRETIYEIQREVVREQPFTTLAFPDRIASYRTDRFERWPAGGPERLTDYLRLERVGDADTLEMLLGDGRITKNRNPIAPEHRTRGHVTDLLYEPLVRTVSDGSDPVPWLARAIEWDEGGGSLTAAVELRETPWHDGEALTAEDVAFTYDFLNDTSLGEFDSPVPTPWRRGRVSLVEAAEATADDVVRLDFGAASKEVAGRAFEVPILPKHVWQDLTSSADLAGIDIGGQTTEAVVFTNEEPVGSGPLQFESAAADQEIVLTTFEDHFLNSAGGDGLEEIPESYAQGLPFQEVRFQVMPSPDAAVQVLESDDADATADSLGASVVPRIGRDETISLSISRSSQFYHVGYDCRNAPLSDPRFRRVVARLLDREWLVSESFAGYATPTETPLKDPWTPEELRWDDPEHAPELAFFGEDGELDAEAAREAFREAGYTYQDDRIVRRGGS